MKGQRLYLIDANGKEVTPAIKSAVEDAFQWAVAKFTEIDSAVLANFAERLALVMHENKETVQSEQRYAYSSMHRQVRDYLRSKKNYETPIEIDHELAQFTGVTGSFQDAVDRSILFEQIQATLNERDRHILGMLREGHYNLSEVASELKIDYAAAKKAAQRVRERVAKILETAKNEDALARLTRSKEVPSRRLVGARDLAKKWI